MAEAKMGSSRDLRVFLLRQMEQCANGEADIQAVKAITNIAQQVYNTLSIELKTAVARAKHGEDLDVVAIKFDE